MSDLAKLIAEETQDAYSFYAFGFDEWRNTAQALLDLGFTADEAGWILRSKITRWARDAHSEADEGKAEYVVGWISSYGFERTRAWI